MNLHTFKHWHKSPDGVESTVKVTTNGVTLDEILIEMHSYLLAVGYQLGENTRLEIVEDE